MISRLKQSLISAGVIFGAIILAGGILLLLTEPRKNQDSVNTAAIDWDQVRDDPDKTMTINWMGIAAYAAASQDAWIKTNLEQRFNVRINAIYLDWNSYNRRLPLMLAGGDLPDVMWNGDPLGVRNNIRNKFIIEIPWEVILKYAPNYVNRLNRCGKEAWLYSHYNEKNYGLPTFTEAGTRPRIGTWRKDWLENVGITKVPETIAEMENALRKFRYDDPDGNGLTDTYGWSPNVGHWSLAYTEIFCAYDILPFDFIKRDGCIVWGGIQPECKEVLKLLRRWYAEGLIDPDFIIDSQNNAAEGKFMNGRTGYLYPLDSWASYDTANNNSLAAKLRKLSGGGEITPAPPLRNAAGKRVGRTWGGAAHVLQFGAGLAAEPEKVIRILKMIEAITNDEQLYLETTSGKWGLHWELEPGRGIRLQDEFLENKITMKREMLGQGGFSCSFFYPSNLFDLYQIPYMPADELKFITENRNPEWTLMNPLGKSDILPSASRYLRNLRDYQQQIYAKIISGELPLESFDSFVGEWLRRGGARLTEEANEMSTTINKIYEFTGAVAHAE